MKYCEQEERETRREGAGLAILQKKIFNHSFSLLRRARAQADEAEQQKLAMEALLEKLAETEKRWETSEKGCH